MSVAEGLVKGRVRRRCRVRPNADLYPVAGYVAQRQTLLMNSSRARPYVSYCWFCVSAKTCVPPRWATSSSNCSSVR